MMMKFQYCNRGRGYRFGHVWYDLGDLREFGECRWYYRSPAETYYVRDIWVSLGEINTQYRHCQVVWGDSMEMTDLASTGTLRTGPSLLVYGDSYEWAIKRMVLSKITFTHLP